ALTVSPSCTWIARTTPVSNGWMTLLRPLGMILPVAVATMSTLPRQAQATASTNTAMIVAPIARALSRRQAIGGGALGPGDPRRSAGKHHCPQSDRGSGLSDGEIGRGH